MKKIFLGATVMALAASCTAITYDGPYSKEGYYENKKQEIYIDTPNNQDSLLYSFGTLGVEVKSKVVYIPVRILGMPPTKDMNFSVKVLEDKSTAKMGENFAALPDHFVIQKDSVNGSIAVELFRTGLPDDKPVNKSLVLELVATSDLKPVDGMRKEVKLLFNDYLAAPQWWDYYTYLFGDFSVVKYRKFLEYFDGSPKKFEDTFSSDQSTFFANIVKAFKYFEAHPEYGITTPPGLYIPYTD